MSRWFNNAVQRPVNDKALVAPREAAELGR